MRQQLHARKPENESGPPPENPSRQARRQVVAQMRADYQSSTEGAAQEYLKAHRQERGGE